MTFRLFLARLPTGLDSANPLIIQDFLALARQGKRTCLRAAIEMCADLHHNGTQSRFIKHLGGPLYELKKRASDGGMRVYFLRHQEGFVLFHAECKNENNADSELLADGLDIIEALENELPVLT